MIHESMGAENLRNMEDSLPPTPASPPQAPGAANLSRCKGSMYPAILRNASVQEMETAVADELLMHS